MSIIKCNFSFTYAYYITENNEFELNFTEIYTSYADDIYRFAFHLTGNYHNAKDITSDTFIRAWTHRSNIRVETLKAYLLTIARNLYLEQLRKRKNPGSVSEEIINPSPGPDILLESRLKLEQIHNFLQALPEVDRTAFILHIYNDMPYAEIARVLELSLSGVKVKVYRVRKKLIKYFKDTEAY